MTWKSSALKRLVLSHIVEEEDMFLLVIVPDACVKGKEEKSDKMRKLNHKISLIKICI